MPCIGLCIDDSNAQSFITITTICYPGMNIWYMINNVCCVSFAGHRLIISIVVKKGGFFHENEWIVNEFQLNEAIKLTTESILEVDIQQYFRFYSFKTK